MVIKIHGMGMSTCTRRVATVFKELNVPYELVPIDLRAGAHKSPQYLELQPFGQVPVLEEEDGFKVYESRAIARYIAAKYGKGKLIPTDLKELALFEQAASIEQNNFDPYASGIGAEKVFKAMQGGTPDEAKVAELTKTLEAKLQVYEVILGKQKYLAGNEVTLADLFHLPYGALITDHAGVKGLTATPNVARWWADISSRPSWNAVKGGA